MAKTRKPTPKVLGSGAAARVGMGLAARKSRLDAAIEAQSGGAPKPRAKAKAKKGK